MYSQDNFELSSDLEYLVSCYKKLKYHYYNNKGNVFIREKIAIFEFDKVYFKYSFQKLDSFIKDPASYENLQYIDSLVNRIDYFVLPKSFNESKSENITSNLNQRKLEKVNFFIDIPIELHILDTYWTVLLSTLENSKRYINPKYVYGNTINKHLLSKSKSKFNYNRFLFSNYFTKYNEWKTNTYKRILNNYTQKKSTLLIKFDIKDYYYTVRFDFNFSKYFPTFTDNANIVVLSELFRRVYYVYFDKIKRFRNDLENININSLPLPLGLFSSMHISNLYLSKIDNLFIGNKKIHYGRYVDDFLICIDKEITNDELDNISKNNELEKIGIVDSDNTLNIINLKNLKINENKIEMLYFSKNGSKKLLDDYYNSLKSMPSDIAFSSLESIEISNSSQHIDNFEIESHIDLLKIENINKYKVVRFFHLLKNQIRREKNIESKDEYENDIEKIDNYFKGEQVIENFANWQNYLYFLVLCNDNNKILYFFEDTVNKINSINIALFKHNYLNSQELQTKLKQSLIYYLNITLNFALSIDYENSDIQLEKITDKKKILAIYESNMFDNHLVEVPIFNYLNHRNRHSYKNVQIKDLLNINYHIIDNFKVNFSPRFVYSNEIQLLNNLLNVINLKHDQIQIDDLYYQFNALVNSNFYSKNNEDPIDFSRYSLRRIILNGGNPKNLSALKIAMVNIDLDLENINDLTGNWSYSEHRRKFDILQKILLESIYDKNSKADILVFPELFLPLNWINDLVLFSKQNNVAIITGIKYVNSSDNLYHNLILSLYPVKEDDNSPIVVYLDLREKNDYSYIEKYNELFLNNNMQFKDSPIANYHIFEWNNIKISSLLCFEFTDIVSRGLHKNNVDLLVISEANKDTNYFSSIVNSASRDLHSIIIQSNISCYGDSKITGPYKTEVKDKVIIKGGINANVIIGEINLTILKEYQEKIKSGDTRFINEISISDRSYKNIKKPPARFFPIDCSAEES